MTKTFTAFTVLAVCLALVTGCNSKKNAALEVQRQLFEPEALQAMQSELEGLPSQIADLSVNCSEQRDRIAMFKQDNAERVTLGWPLRYDGLDKLGADVLSISSNRLAKLKADQRRLPKAVELTKLDLELRKQGKGKEADRILTDIA